MAPRRTWTRPGEPSRNVRAITSAQYDGVGTSALRAWLLYWEGISDGSLPRNAGDEEQDAEDEVRRLRLEIEARTR